MELPEPICFSTPFNIFALLFSLRPSRSSDPESHSRPFSPPLHYGSCLAFPSREDVSPVFPRRFASNCAYPRSVLSAVGPFLYFCKYILVYIQGSPSGCVLREIPGVTQVEKGHAGNTAVATAYLCWVKHGHRRSRTGVPADYYY